MKGSIYLLKAMLALVMALGLLIMSSKAETATLSGTAEWETADENNSILVDIVQSPGGQIDGKIKYCLRKQTMPDVFSGAWCFPGNIVAQATVHCFTSKGDGGPGSLAVAAGPVTGIYDPSNQSHEWLVFCIQKGESGSIDRIRVFFAPEGDVSTPGTARYFCANPTTNTLQFAKYGNFTLRP